MSVALRLPGFDDYPPDTPPQSPRRRPRARSGAQPIVGEFADERLPMEDEAADHATSDPTPAEPTLVEAPPFVVEVVTSARRKRTVGAQLVGDVLRITIPSWMGEAEAAPFVRDFTAKFRRKLRSESVDLPARAAELAKRYRLQVPQEIRWVDDMTSRWASCTSSTGVIRMSSRLTAFPGWVLDYVIVHELAHLTEANHSARFWKLVNAYALAERATGYLIAKSGDAEDEF